MHIRLSMVLTLAGLLATGEMPARGAETDADRAGDEQLLQAARIGVDGPALLEFFRKRTLTQADQDRLAELVRQLGDQRYKSRVKAGTELLIAGKTAIPFLEAALNDPDPEIVFRVGLCLGKIERGRDDLLVSAAARLLAWRQPAGTAAVLLAFVPSADSEDVLGEVQAALNAVAWRDGKPDPLLVKALGDQQPAKRAAAAAALIRASPAGKAHVYHKVLRDADSTVRLQAALAFFEARDKEAVPVLIALLGELPPDRAWHVEEALYRLAGEAAPQATSAVKTTPAQRSAAWAQWWRKNRDGIDLAKIEVGQRLLGYTVAVLNGSPVNGDQVVEYDRDGRPRWQITRLATPRDAQVLPGNRVLIAEEYGGRVTERNFKGEVLWEKRINGPIACQRLPNGHTFIGTRQQLLIVDKSGKEVSRYRSPINGQTFATALWFPDGTWGGVMSDYVTFRRLDKSGKEIASFKVDFFSIIGNIEVLPNRHLLVPEYRKNRLAEFDAQGHLTWELSLSQPTSVVKLPNGNMLVSSWTRRWLGEINRKGKIIRQQQLDGMPSRVRRR